MKFVKYIKQLPKNLLMSWRIMLCQRCKSWLETRHSPQTPTLYYPIRNVTHYSWNPVLASTVPFANSPTSLWPSFPLRTRS